MVWAERAESEPVGSGTESEAEAEAGGAAAGSAEWPARTAVRKRRRVS
jgi:hypothetical protein